MALATGTALALGAALGAAKYGADANAASRQRTLQGKIATYSPWTGIKPSNVQDPNAFGDILQGTAALGTLNQGFGAATGATAGAGAAGAGATAAAGPSLLSADQLAAVGANPAIGAGASSPWMSFGANSFNPYALAGK